MMKKIVYILMTSLVLSFASCAKEEVRVSESETVSKGPDTFIVAAPDTKTTISDHNILWTATDKIRVYGYTADPASNGNAVYKIKSGAGTATAVFELDEGESLGSFENYYAVYPSTIQLDVTKFATGKLEVTSGTKLSLDQTIPSGAFYDPTEAIMTASYSAGKLSFTHGVAYIKVQVPDTDGVTAIQVTFGANATGTRPIYNLNGSYSSVEGGTTAVKVSGSFTGNSAYYLLAPARNSNPGNITVKMWKGSVSASKTTSSLTSKRLQNGQIYDLGCPPISFDPVINATAPSKLAYDATSGSFTFTITNPDGVSVPTVEWTSGAWIHNVDSPEDKPTVSGPDGEGKYTVSFNCDANDDALAVERTGSITVSYSGAEDKVITIKQGVAGGSVTVNTYWYYFDSENSNSVVNTSSKFTATNDTIDFSSTGSCGANSFTCESISCTRGVKLNSSGYVQFTTSEDVTPVVTFYYACKASGDNSGARIKITPTSPAGDAVVYNNFNTFGTYSSQTRTLSASTTYKIARDNKELALIMVKLVETSN